MDPIITIGREYGSGGREIGKLVADKLGVPFYDKEILTRAAEESGLCHELLERHDEKNTVSGMLAGFTLLAKRGCFWPSLTPSPKLPRRVRA